MTKKSKVCVRHTNNNLRLPINKFLLLFILIIFNSYSQASQISLRVNNKTIKEVFQEIEQQSDYLFFYYEGLIDANKKIQINAFGQPIEKVLEEILKGTNITYTIDETQIYLRKKEAIIGPVPEVKQQDSKVTGVVRDDLGDPLPGVHILVVGSTRGVVTDLDGTFEINVSSTDKLTFSFLGMQDHEVTIGNQKHLVITMMPKIDELEEVAIVAFGRQKKESVSASITTVRPSELKVPSSNLTTALAGRVAGLVSYQRSGEPGEDDASFFVRGVTSFNYGNAKPLILIDGVEMSSSDLARLQTDDIASFSIMKDAAATALYGARGANGVIMVTTKEGKEGVTSISFRYESSISSPTKKVQLADPITYMKLNNEAVQTRNPLGTVPYSMEKIESTQRGDNPMMYPANDWYSILFKDHAVNHRANFNVTGGGKVARFYIAGTFNQDQGVIKTTKDSNNAINLKRYLLRSNVNMDMTPTTEVIVRLHGTFDDYTGPLDSGSDLYQKAMWSDPVSFPPYYLPDAANQHKNHILFGNMDQGQFINPYADMVKGFKSYSKSLMLAQFEVKQKLDFITEGLSFRGLFSTDRSSYFDVNRQYSPYYYLVSYYDKTKDEYILNNINPESGTEWLYYYEGKKEISTTTYFEAVMNYDRTFNNIHGISALLVYNMRNKLAGNQGSLLLSLPKRNLGLSGRFTYSYDNRYFTEFNFGYNGSERFAKNERFGFFPSVGAGWIISYEPFWLSSDNFFTQNITKLKLKATYGLVGNDNIGEDKDRFFYQSDVTLYSGGRSYSWGENFDYTRYGVVINRYANELISWEVSKKMNLGVEFTLWDKLEIQADYYTEHRSNLLMARADIPSTMGLQQTPQVNIGKAKGSGFDISADLNHYFTNDFWITGRFNYTYATAKYTVYEEPDNSLTPWLSQIGNPITQRYGYIAERLFVDDQDVANSPTQTFGEYMGGDIKYKDINGDDEINQLDRVAIGYPDTPEIIYGFGLSTGYKNVDFSFFFQGLGRESFWIDVDATYPFVDTKDKKQITTSTTKTALLKAYADDHWSEDNRNVKALWPRLSDSYVNNNTQQSTWFMRDGSFLRLKSVELGYSVPRHFLRKIHVADLRVYASGTNLLTFSKFKLWDPEMAGDGLKYPIQKVINFGVQLSF